MKLEAFRYKLKRGLVCHIVRTLKGTKKALYIRKRSSHVIHAVFRKHHLTKENIGEVVGGRQDWKQGDSFGLVG